MFKKLNLVLFLLLSFLLSFSYANMRVNASNADGNNQITNIHGNKENKKYIINYSEDFGYLIHGARKNINFNLVIQDDVTYTHTVIELTSQEVNISEQIIMIYKDDASDKSFSFITNELGEGIIDFTISTYNNSDLVDVSKSYFYITAYADYDCFSTISYDNTREIYYSIFHGDSENEDLLQKRVRQEFVYGDDVQSNSYVQPQGSSYMQTSQSSDIKVYGTILWTDTAGNTHPVKNVRINIYDEDLLGYTYCGNAYTNSNGDYELSISNSTFLENGGIDVFIEVYPESDHVSVIHGGIGNFSYISETTSNISSGQSVDKSHTFGNSSTRDRAYSVFQAAEHSAQYVKDLSGNYLSHIVIEFPSLELFEWQVFGTCYVPILERMFIIAEDYADWDVVMHEYGHYISDKFGILNSEGGDHFSGDDLSVTRNSKSVGTKLAWNEGVATYFGLSAQMYFNLIAETNPIPNVGDSTYDDTIDASISYDVKSRRIGESNEATIAGLLISLVDGKSANDLCDFDYQEIWNIIINNKTKIIDSFVEELYEDKDSYIKDIAFNLSHFFIAPAPNESSTGKIYSFNNFTFYWTAQGAQGSYQQNEFILHFYDKDLNLIYKTGKINNTQYTPTDSEWNKILSTSGDYLYWSVEGFSTYEFTTGGYLSKFVRLDKPAITNLSLNSSINGSITLGSFIWYKFKAPYSGTFNFETTGTTDTVGELFNNILAGRSTLGRLNNATYDDDAGEGTNFKTSYNLVKDQIVYIRVRGFNWDRTGNFSLKVERDVENVYNINCHSTQSEMASLSAGKEIFYSINVNCNVMYEIRSSANSSIQMSLYDVNMNLISSSPNMFSNNTIAIFNRRLQVGTYYLKLNFASSIEGGDITTTIKSTETEQIWIGSNKNVLTHLHNGLNKYVFYNNYNSQFVNLTLTAIKNGGMVTYPEGVIIVKDYNGDILEKINLDGFYNPAQNKNNVNSLIVFLPYIGKYEIEVHFTDTNISSLMLNLSSIESFDKDLFTLSESTNTNISNFSNISKGDEMQKITLKQAGRFNFAITGLNDSTFIIIKERIRVDGEIYYDTIYAQPIGDNFSYTKDLVEGIYYIGYINAEKGQIISLNITREVTQHGEYNLLPDPLVGFISGSEVNLNGGNKEENTITQGFTRLIYLASGDSRLDYDWYSSNTNVAIITDYGTVLGLQVTQDTVVKIMAVKRTDPSIVFVKEFIIKKDLKTFYSDPIVYNLSMTVTSGSGETQSIDLSSLLVPIKLLQHYNWSSNSSLVTVDTWGRIYAYPNSVGQSFTITGNYKFNSRVKIYINVTVV